MAKTKGPLFSNTAHGSVGGVLTYSQRPRKGIVRHQRKQSDVETDDRTTQRGYFEEAVEKWNELTDEQKEDWNDFVKDKNA